VRSVSISSFTVCSSSSAADTEESMVRRTCSTQLCSTALFSCSSTPCLCSSATAASSAARDERRSSRRARFTFPMASSQNCKCDGSVSARRSSAVNACRAWSSLAVRLTAPSFSSACVGPAHVQKEAEVSNHALTTAPFASHQRTHRQRPADGAQPHPAPVAAPPAWWIAPPRGWWWLAGVNARGRGAPTARWRPPAPAPCGGPHDWPPPLDGPHARRRRLRRPRAW